MFADLFRVSAFGAALPALVGVWFVTVGDDVDQGMLWLLIPTALAGLVESARFHPLRLTEEGATERMNASWKRFAIDLGWLALALLAALLLGAAITQFVDPDLTAFAVAPLLTLLAATAALVGVLVGLLVALPIVALATALRTRMGGGRVEASSIWMAVLLLAVVTFAVGIVLATDVDGGSSRSRMLPGFVVLMTGIETDSARIVSEPLAWVARISLLAIVVSTVALARAGRALRRRRRP